MATTAALGLDVYQQARTQAHLRQVAAVYADYVSRDTDLSQDALYSLADFLHEAMLDPLPAAFFVGAVEKAAPDAAPSVLWVINHVGSTNDPDLDKCHQILPNATANLPDEFTMEDNEVAVVAEVCVKQDNGDLAYAHHILPARAGKPDKPK